MEEDALTTLIEYIGCMCETEECSGTCVAALAEVKWRELTQALSEAQNKETAISATVQANAESLARIELLLLLGMTNEDRRAQGKALGIDLDAVLVARHRQITVMLPPKETP